ncbi:ATP-binding protein [Actinomadura rubrisoli]|uniref:ATP-binding protein n=1 Tax=Actinomadura rubrisoli TaxID=2530368 RepID=A0A4R5A4R3_9ACTN|nr:ATP-binding protein [Actinomadura rubrisoli]TDD65916.1 ATP-binding protein [Actinomadura rubrisoli]
MAGDEREHRVTTRITRLERAAKFEEAGTLEDFEYDYSPERTKVAGRIRGLTEMRWHAAGEPVLLNGSVGTGKTRVASGLGRLAIRLGHDVRFGRTHTMLRHLAGGHERGTWERRLNALLKPSLLILDNFAAGRFTETQTLDLYEVITNRPGKALIIVSGRAPKEWYGQFPESALPLAEAILDRVVNTGHHIVMNGPSYRAKQRRSRAGQHDDTTQTSTSTTRAARQTRNAAQTVAPGFTTAVRRLDEQGADVIGLRCGFDPGVHVGEAVWVCRMSVQTAGSKAHR